VREDSVLVTSLLLSGTGNPKETNSCFMRVIAQLITNFSDISFAETSKDFVNVIGYKTRFYTFILFLYALYFKTLVSFSGG